jgi:hypothetical protein
VQGEVAATVPGGAGGDVDQYYAVNKYIWANSHYALI